jgi:ppGpp synthetase/RelA/SpoT-type nucleotidyltranferase
MKIPASVRNAFDDQKAKYERLKVQVDTTVAGFKKARWHYESRVKVLQSYALKLESGRFRDPQGLEDFFACTLVVANLAEIDEAEQLIRQAFEFQERRPNAPGYTHKRPDQFPFDDLRLYVAVPVDPAVPPKGIEGVRFEFQVKTFLQHAWSIATHDLVYKTDDVSWSKERIAYQTKAMLEHAEVSIQEAEELAGSGALAKEDRQTKSLKRAIGLLREQWANDQLPADVRRLAENLLALTTSLKLDLDRVKAILDAGKAASGSHPTNLSPYATVVQYLLSAEQAAMVAYLEADPGPGRPPTAILIPAEIDVPAGIDRTRWRNAVSVS